MDDAATHPRSTRALERILALAGALLCVAVSAYVWQALLRRQPMWPFPGLYLVELPVIAALGAFGILRGERGRSPAGATLTWGAIGALAAFSALAWWSIGAIYVPVVAILLFSALLHDRPQWRGLARHVGIGAAAALAQAALMLIAVALLVP
jgi:hypothetical protein